MKIFNLLGEVIHTLMKALHQAGYYRLRWDGRDHSGNTVTAGVYLYQIIATGEMKFGEMKRMALAK